MDVFTEVENMAANAAPVAEVTTEDIVRWQKLFGFSRAQAIQAIEEYREDIFRTSNNTDDLWVIVAEEKQAHGFDRESYESSLQRAKVPVERALVAAAQPANQHSHSTYIVKLESPVNSPETFRAILGLGTVPSLYNGTDDDGNNQASFCIMDGPSKIKLLEWLTSYRPSFRPTIVRLAKARKNLDEYTKFPCLGVDTTLPQFRANADNLVPQYPEQNQYPVWYFFYGKLANATVLESLLGSSGPPQSYLPATIRRGEIKTWMGKYNALVDGSATDHVSGSAYLVASKELEEALQFFETDVFEVVRCTIETPVLPPIEGLVFRFCGDANQIL